MPDIRERKKADKIKGKERAGHIGKDARRAMTVKLQRELAEKTHKRSEGGTDEAPPEAEAVAQAEESAADLAGGVRERAASGIAKAKRRKREKWKAREEKPRAEQAAAPDPTPEAGNGAPPFRERQTTPRTRQTASTTTGDAPEPQPTPPAPKERMRSEAIRERQTAPRERPAPAPDTAPKAPIPQERGRQKAVADARARQAETRRGAAAPRTGASSPSDPAPLPEKKSVSLENQSTNQSPREKLRNAAKPKEKPAGGALTPKTRGNAKDAKATPATARGKGAKQAAARAKQRFRQNAQKKLLQQTNRRATKRAAILARRTSAVVVKGVASAVGAIAGLAGGAMLLPIILVIALVGAIAASPFGIFFSSEPTPGAMPLNVAVAQLNMELADTLESLQAGDYDSIDLQGTGPDWREVVAVFAVKTAGADDGVDVAALTPDRVDRLKAVFWDMCAITSAVESIDHPGTDGGEGWTEKLLHLTVTHKSADDMRTEYRFNERQNTALTELLAELATMEMVLTDLSASQEQARELLRNLPFDLDPERRAVVENACKLVGKVTYFWGGKSLVLGWDSRWGTIQKVWAEGNSTSGTYRPYGLDCSGFVDWVFYNVSGGAYVLGHGGGATMQHTYCTPISWADAIPGDLVFYPDDMHVGIVGGRDADGNLLIIHCASSYNCVVITSASGFTSVGRPTYYAAH